MRFSALCGVKPLQSVPQSLQSERKVSLSVGNAASHTAAEPRESRDTRRGTHAHGRWALGPACLLYGRIRYSTVQLYGSLTLSHTGWLIDRRSSLLSSVKTMLNSRVIREKIRRLEVIQGGTPVLISEQRTNWDLRAPPGGGACAVPRYRLAAHARDHPVAAV